VLISLIKYGSTVLVKGRLGIASKMRNPFTVEHRNAAYFLGSGKA